ncbi:polysaccharide deacetylase family protein [Evansella sp. AB-rgal1]|uniref:polysaccharide deacetylase family protein n=1 Tax=Evansella sp. AB-rgal1 TaxID=3242696 RepID=UPI00359E7F11
MKRYIFNITFLISFLVIFSIIVRIYYGDFEEALATELDFFPPDESLPLSECKDWGGGVRDFHIEPGHGAKEVSVLMYHRVIDEDDLGENHFNDNDELHSTIILKNTFEEQMALLHEHNYTTLTAKELLLFLKKEIEVPKNSVVLTFDDGFKDNYVEVYPILKNHDFHALNFIITAAITKRDPKYVANAYQYLSTSDIQNSCDVFDFQSHTYNFHKRAFSYSPYLIVKPEEEILEDIRNSITNLGGRNRAFAYPYGAYDEKAVSILKELDFEMAFTVIPELAKPGIHVYEIPRIEVFETDTLKDFKRKINLIE